MQPDGLCGVPLQETIHQPGSIPGDYIGRNGDYTFPSKGEDGEGEGVIPREDRNLAQPEDVADLVKASAGLFYGDYVLELSQPGYRLWGDGHPRPGRHVVNHYGDIYPLGQGLVVAVKALLGRVVVVGGGD